MIRSTPPPCRRRRALLVAALAATLATATAQAADQDLARRLDTWLAPAVADGYIAGALLVADGGEIVYENWFGLADYELGVPNGPQTRYGIASITKVLQLILLAQLVDDGALAMTDSLARWLPDFPLAAETTVLDLANHTAGVPHRVTEPHEECVPRTAADMVELVKEQGLMLDQRGERNYSSAGYSVLARVLELAGGDDWSALMQRHVFDPAGMVSTMHPEDGRLIPGRADSYDWTFAGLRNSQPRDLSFLVGAGSLYSTPRDLWRAYRAVVDTVYGETAQAYVIRGRESIAWTGRTASYCTTADFDLPRGRAVIVCANVATGVVERMRRDIPRLLDGEEPPPLPDLAALEVVDLGEDELRRFEGRFEMRPGSVLDVSVRDGSLHAKEWELLPLGGDRFFSVQDFNPVVFVRDSAGAIVRMDWGEGDPPLAMPRVGDLAD